MKLTPYTDAGVRTMSVYAFNKAPRCGAKTRAGTACLSPTVHGKKRCRMHGGAHGSGAPKGSLNAFKHGCTTRHAKDLRHRTRALLKASYALLSFAVNP